MGFRSKNCGQVCLVGKIACSTLSKNLGFPTSSQSINSILPFSHIPVNSVGQYKRSLGHSALVALNPIRLSSPRQTPSCLTLVGSGVRSLTWLAVVGRAGGPLGPRGDLALDGTVLDTGAGSHGSRQQLTSANERRRSTTGNEKRQQEVLSSERVS